MQKTIVEAYKRLFTYCWNNSRDFVAESALKRLVASMRYAGIELPEADMAYKKGDPYLTWSF